MAVAATLVGGSVPVLTVHDLPEQAAAAAGARSRAAGGQCRAVLHVGAVHPGSPPTGAAVDHALALLATTVPGQRACTPAF